MKKTEIKPEYPSRFGSHTSMIDTVATAEFNTDSIVVLKDEFGLYTTERSRLDTGLADPNRYATRRLQKLFDRKKDKTDG